MVLTVLLALLLAAPPAAFASNKIVGDVRLEVPDEVQLSRIDVRPLSATCDPASVEVGIPCGMTEMCGQDPCLCGVPDEYGACACNGTKIVETDVRAASGDKGVVRTFELFGRTYLVACGEGTADVHVDASVPHYNAASGDVSVTVAGWSALDVVKAAVALAIIAALVWLLGALVRLIARGIKRMVRSVRAHGRER